MSEIATLSAPSSVDSKNAASQRIVARSKFFFRGGEKFFVKGATYGPFKPSNAEVGHPNAIYLPKRAQVQSDLKQICDAGINTLRLYHVPPQWFLDECETAQVKAFITIPWAQHVSFMDSREFQRNIIKSVTEGVDANQNHPAVLAYAVGNEIPSGIVRWYGSNKIERFIETLVDAARQVDPRPLYTYANYPPTEYLLPGSVDFYCYNVYLHRQKDFQGYLARLQNLTGEKPLLLGEFGMDTIRHPEEEQAELFHWHVETVARMGLAGTVLFSWTDEWFTGGHQIEDWKFGLVDAQRKPKKSFFEIQRLFKHTRRIELKKYPRISVVVCSYNGAPTLAACLTSLLQMDYPDYEVILVDDGSTDNTQEIVKDFPKIKVLTQKNMGLSFARNVGMEAASGEIIAYTDSDCMADVDWLYYLAGTFQEGDFASVGGPNISPPAQSWSQACVAVSPGQPSHVLLDDSRAEHIPGCNMAFYKTALQSIGGFDPVYRKAGDDVDACWRLMEKGYQIGFSPAAVVWHHRRFNVTAYFKQQMGYGEAEALLRFKHLVYFGPTGSARWRGQVYGGSRFSSLISRPIIYHGVFGMGFFQCIYQNRPSDFVQLMTSIEWNAITLITLLIFLIKAPAAWYVPVILFACTMGVGFTHAMRARIEQPYQGFASRVLITLLAIGQPVVREWARYFTWIKKKRTPTTALLSAPESRMLKVVWDRPAVLSFWNEQDVGREQFLKSLEKQLVHEGWNYSRDTGWTNWDYQIYTNRWWQMHLLSMTEEHGNGKRLTRVRLHPSPTTFLRLIATVLGVISLLLLLHFSNPGPKTVSKIFQTPATPWDSPITDNLMGGIQTAEFMFIGFWFCFIFIFGVCLVGLSMYTRKRVAQVVEFAAQACKLTPFHSTRKFNF